MSSGYLKIKVVEGRKFDASKKSPELIQIRPIVQIQFKYDCESTNPAPLCDISPKWGEIFDFHILNDEQYFVLTVYNEEINEENLLGETRIGTISFKDQDKLNAWFPFYLKNKKKYNFMGEIHIIGKYVEENRHDEQETDPDFILSDEQKEKIEKNKEEKERLKRENEERELEERERLKREIEKEERERLEREKLKTNVNKKEEIRNINNRILSNNRGIPSNINTPLSTHQRSQNTANILLPPELANTYPQSYTYNYPYFYPTIYSYY